MTIPSFASYVIPAAILAATCLPGASLAQEFPTKPLRIVTASAPGGGNDQQARSLAPGMSKDLGQQVIVENRPGAGGLLAYETVARQSPADGYTMALAVSVVMVTSPLLVKDIRFDPIGELPPVIGFNEQHYVLTTPAGRNWSTVGEVVAFAKANPGKLNLAYSSPNTILQVSVLSPELAAAVVNIPYNGTANVLKAVLADEAQLGIPGASDPALANNRIKVVGISGDKRASRFPDVPTFVEQGLPRIPGYYNMLAVRAGTPKPIMDRLYRAAVSALRDPDLVSSWQKIQQDIITDGPEIAARKVAEEARFYAEAAKKTGMQPK